MNQNDRPTSLQPLGNPQTLEEWTRNLTDREMPIFSRTVQALNDAMEDKRSGVLELSRIILEDPTLTAKILKLSNTPYYNPGRQKLATVTRAIVLIGLQVVRDLALACAFIDALLSAQNREQVRQQIARALHSAVQAKSLAILANDPEPEEVFIAALLHNIGQLVFWCFADKQGAAISKLMDQGMDSVQAERQVLGFRLRQLGASLSRRWKLGGLVDEVFSATAPAGRIELVKLGCDVAEQAAKGWDSPEMEPLLRRMAVLTGKNRDDLLEQLKTNGQNTIKLAAQFGAGDCSAYLPSFASVKPDDTAATGTDAQQEPDTDSVRLVQILHDISVLLASESSPNLTIILELILEGCYRALAMDRVLLALMDPGRKVIRETAAFGWPPQTTRPAIQLAVQSTPHTLVSYAIEQGQTLWVRSPSDPPYAELFTPSIVSQLGRQECLLAPIGIKRRMIGLIYADRAYGKRPLRQENFDAFRQLTLQANIAFKLCQ